MTTTSQRDRLVTALASDDWSQVDQLGFKVFFQVLKGGFNMSKGFNTTDAIAYARVLGNRDPVELHSVILKMAEEGEEWRPSPSKVAKALLGKKAKPSSLPSPGMDSASIIVVAQLLEQGEPECECGGAHVFAIDTVGVVKCMDCGGLDPGQVDDVYARRAA